MGILFAFGWLRTTTTVPPGAAGISRAKPLARWPTALTRIANKPSLPDSVNQRA